MFTEVMNWIRAEGTLENLRKILGVDGVEHVGRGVRPLGGGRYSAEAHVQEAAIPVIEALGVIVTVTQTQADIDERLAQVRSEQSGVA
jgi:hypothetical protein